LEICPTCARKRFDDGRGVPMNCTNAIIRNDLESACFGVEFGRLNAAAIPMSAFAGAIVQADADGLQVLSTRIDATDLPQVQTLEDLGFRVMDTLVYYRRKLTKASAAPAPANLSASSDLGGAAADAASAIARRAFHNYMGHYHADPRLSDEAADEAYADWIARLLRAPTPDQIALGSVKEGKLVGFLVGQPRNHGTSEIILNAILPEEQGGGRYTALLDDYMDRVAKRGDREVVISTQLQNYGVQRVWVRAGFTLYRSYHTLHRWAAGSN
jgi:GNAT superfamily N-acetyltransferase